MARMSFPPGYRFHPTDVELIMYYLKRKELGKKLRSEAVTEVNVYEYSPWELPDKSCLKDLEWFFFCPVLRKYANGAKSNRTTKTGFWKSTGNDRTVMHDGRKVGMVKTLVFHEGQAAKGNRTDWVLHEYRILENELADARVGPAAYVLLKLFKKSGLGPKNGAQYGAPFNEEEWDADDTDEDEDEICAETPQQSKIFPFPAVANDTGSVVKSTFVHGNASNASLLPPVTLSPPAAAHNNFHSVGTSSFIEGWMPTVAVLPSESGTRLAAAHDDSNYVIMGLLSPVNSPLPVVSHNNCNSVGTCSSFEGGMPTVSVLQSENRSLSAVTHDNSNSVITGGFIRGVPPTGPLPGLGPSTTMSLADDVASPVGEVDLESLLATLTEDPSIPSDANDVNQVNGKFKELEGMYGGSINLPDFPSDANDVNRVNGKFMELDGMYSGSINLPDWEELWHWDQSCLSVDLRSLLAMVDPSIPSDANDVNQVNGEFMELDGK